MGVLLALLLGVAAAFFVLAMPIRMLETVTTFTRLSKLMVQAEPPISPNDRTLLSVLAAILTAGIGWVLVDWLVFGRAGMSTLIRTREDDYEDEDEDHFRPTDPLDLVTPAEDPAAEWPVPSMGDARRPLSARTDIGDPPPALDPFGAPLAGLNQALPPISEILPGTGVSAPPLQPNALPPVIQPAAFPQVTPFPDAEPAPAEMPAPAGGLPTWMPAPGLRPDGQAADPLPAAFYEEPTESRPEPEAASAPAPDPVAPPSLIDAPAVPQPGPPLPTPQAGAFVPPRLADEMPPLAAQPFADLPPSVAVPQTDQQPAAAQVPAQPAPPPRPLPEPGFDRARLEELLVRLERGLQQRRAAAAARAQAEQPQPAPAAAAPQQAPAPVPAPMPTSAAAPPPLSEPPAPPPVIEPVPAMRRDEPPSAPAPALILPVAPPRAVPELRNDELLDQPLHVTLDLLRSMVKR